MDKKKMPHFSTKWGTGSDNFLTKHKTNKHFYRFTILIPHARGHAESGCYRSQNTCNSLKNEFPSFLFQVYESLIVNNELLSPFRKTN